MILLLSLSHHFFQIIVKGRVLADNVMLCYVIVGAVNGNNR